MFFKRLLLAAVLTLAAIAPVPAQAVGAHEHVTAAQKKECIVYVTRTGARYHKAGCSSLRRSSIRMTQGEAVQAGFTPCRRCGGSDCDE